MNKLAKEGVTPDNNAAVPLMQALGPEMVPLNQRDYFFQELGMEIPSSEGDYLILKDDFVRRLGEASESPPNDFDDMLETAIGRGWSVDEFPDLSEWIDKNEKPLETLSEGLKRDHFYLPVVRPSNSEIGDLLDANMAIPAATRSITILLTARATRSLQQGQVDNTLADLLTCHRLSTLIANRQDTISFMIGGAQNAIVFQAEEFLLNSSIATAAQLDRYHRDCKSLTPFPTVIECVNEGERYALLESVIRVTKNAYALGKAEQQDDSYLVPSTLDVNAVLRRANRYVDETVAALELEQYAEQIKEVEQLEYDILAAAAEVRTGDWRGYLDRGYANRVYGNLLLSNLLFSPDMLITAEGRVRSRQQLLSIGLALEIHRLQEGTFPETLDIISPRLPEEGLEDYFTGSPLVYKPAGKGYLLYGRGENQQDDEGRSFDDKPTPDQPYQGDDIVLKVEMSESFVDKK